LGSVDSEFEELPTVEITNRDLCMERLIQGGVCGDINLIKREAKLMLYCQERRFRRLAQLTIGSGIKCDARGWALLSCRHHGSHNMCDYSSAPKADHTQSDQYCRIFYDMQHKS
jgi:hypothetical protein